MTFDFQEIRTAAPDEWRAALEEAGPYDFYHTAAYHSLAERHDEGEAILLAWREGGHHVALPLLLRPIDRIPALRQAGKGRFDAVSVYGYSGPVGRPPLPDALRHAFATDLARWLKSRGVVTLFSRLHPLLGNAALTASEGEIVALGPTVAIDLTLPVAEQHAGYRSNHRRDLRKLSQHGFSCRMSDASESIGEFAALYQETMERVDAGAGYMFDEGYFTELLTLPGLRLLLCERDGEVAAGAVLSRCGEIAQYHLGGTRTKWLSSAPMKMIFDQARQWAHEAGCRWLHLGGGLGAREDALFNFKAGFSQNRHLFQVWRWVIDAQSYEDLVHQAGARKDTEFFPAYAA